MTQAKIRKHLTEVFDSPERREYEQLTNQSLSQGDFELQHLKHFLLHEGARVIGAAEVELIQQPTIMTHGSVVAINPYTHNFVKESLSAKINLMVFRDGYDTPENQDEFTSLLGDWL